MRRSANIWPGVALASVLLLLARPAQAYLDPGTGSLVVQVLVGSALACLLGVKVFWRQIRLFAGRLFGRGRKKNVRPGTRRQPDPQEDRPEGKPDD